MKRSLKRLWLDEDGFIFTSEMVLLGSVLVVGGAVGVNAMRDSVNTELGDVAKAIGNVDQTYYYSGVQGHGAYTAGSAFLDQADQTDKGVEVYDRTKIKVCADVFGPKPTRQVVPPKAEAPAPAPANPAPAQNPAPQPAPAAKPEHQGHHGHAHQGFHGHHGHHQQVQPYCSQCRAPMTSYCNACGPRSCPPLPAPCGPYHQPCRTLPPMPAPCEAGLPPFSKSVYGWAGMYGFTPGNFLANQMGSHYIPEGAVYGSKIGFPPPGAHFPQGHGQFLRPAPVQPACNEGVEVRVNNGTNADMQKVVTIKDVAELFVQGTAVTNDGISVLPRLSGLEVLELTDAKLDDGAAIYLAQLRSLCDLRLINVGLSDAGLVPLKSLVGLRTLHLEKTRVTDAGVARFREALPNVQVVYVK